MVSVAAFGPRDPGSNPCWFPVSNSNQKLSFTSNKSVYCNPAMGDTLVGGDKQPIKDALANFDMIYERS